MALPPGSGLRPAPVARRFGFRKGQAVQWAGEDTDVRDGDLGKVLGFTEDRVAVAFPGGRYRFDPEELIPVEETSDGEEGTHDRYRALRQPPPRGTWVRTVRACPSANRDDPAPIGAGLQGRVLKIDDDGDMCIRFHGIDKPQWIKKESLADLRKAPRPCEAHGRHRVRSYDWPLGVGGSVALWAPRQAPPAASQREPATHKDWRSVVGGPPPPAVLAAAVTERHGGIWYLGERVRWRYADALIPEGAEGGVCGCSCDGLIIADFPAGRWRFEPGWLERVPPATPYPPPHWGSWREFMMRRGHQEPPGFEIQGGVVWDVTPGGPADRAGLREGLEVLRAPPTPAAPAAAAPRCLSVITRDNASLPCITLTLISAPACPDCPLDWARTPLAAAQRLALPHPETGVRVHNLSAGPCLWRVLPMQPQNYDVAPGCGMLDPGASAVARITCRAAGGGAAPGDLFEVAARPLPPDSGRARARRSSSFRSAGQGMRRVASIQRRGSVSPAWQLWLPHAPAARWLWPLTPPSASAAVAELPTVVRPVTVQHSPAPAARPHAAPPAPEDGRVRQRAAAVRAARALRCASLRARRSACFTRWQGWAAERVARARAAPPQPQRQPSRRRELRAVAGAVACSIARSTEHRLRSHAFWRLRAVVLAARSAPASLTLSSPTVHRELSGSYQRQRGIRRGMPWWSRDGGLGWISDNGTGYWVVSSTAAHFERGQGWLIAAEPHGAAMPQMCQRWMHGHPQQGWLDAGAVSVRTPDQSTARAAELVLEASRNSPALSGSARLGSLSPTPYSPRRGLRVAVQGGLPPQSPEADNPA
eukprot:TRINITY_DN13884_c0_g1_i2.p1 TRINITY_DN13884_c0_g1~~TRINITY_DN13884_c0_g1_i2.p1  ORF type:complete len:858 (+),score=93.16 TRINITY_DN13884_c0_g1_i2:116-2575(+)